MKTMTLSGSAAACLVLLLAAPLAGQIDTEVRAGVAVGSLSGSAAGLDLVPKLSYEALVLLGVKPGLGIYGGFVRTAFGCEEGFCLDRDLTVVGMHGAAGVELARSVVRLRLGVLYGVTEVGSDGESSDAGVGMHAALGFEIGAGRLRFVPGLSYRRFAAGTAAIPDHATALTADIGVRMRLGGG